MPKGEVPSTHLDLLERPVLGHLAAVDPNNRPQVNPVWFLYDGHNLLLSVKPDTRKFRNMKENPWVALSILDPDNDFRCLELRGRVTSFELFTTLAFVNVLSRKYTGADFTGGVDGEERYKLTIEIESWFAAGS